MSRKVNLAKVRQSLATTCTFCGYPIPPEEVRRTGFDHVLCPKCGKKFIPSAPARTTHQSDLWLYGGLAIR